MGTTCRHSNRVTSGLLAAVIGISVVLVLGFYSNEARKEIHFLCGNFEAGDSFASVVRQLDTINLSEYEIESSGLGKRIDHSSLFNLHMVSCKIEFNVQGEVYSVRLEKPLR